MPYYMGADWSYILILIGAVISMIASAKVKTTYAKSMQERGQERL